MNFRRIKGAATYQGPGRQHHDQARAHEGRRNDAGVGASSELSSTQNVKLGREPSSRNRQNVTIEQESEKLKDKMCRGHHDTRTAVKRHGTR